MMPASGAPRRVAYLFLAALVFLLDVASKQAVSGWLAPGAVRRVVPGFFNLTYVRNPGAAFGLLADYDSGWVAVFLVAFSAGALALLASLLWRGPARLTGVGLGLIAGGAVGNLVDRLRTGAVVDFLDFHLAGYHWPAFNLADSAIVLGAAAVVAEVLRSRRRSPAEA